MHTQPDLKMPMFQYNQNRLFCENVSVLDIADILGTPFYIYSRSQLISNYMEVEASFGDFPHLVCYAVKANSNPHLLHILADKGCGADVVSGGELVLALACGIPPDRIVFAGVGKTDAEIRSAIENDILSIHAESFEELHMIDSIARQMGEIARTAIRVNPDIDARTHEYITTGLEKNKFGIGMDRALDAFKLASSLPGLRVTGLHCHIGSMILDVDPFVQAARSLRALSIQLKAAGIPLESIDIGGGLGVDYHGIVDDGEDSDSARTNPPTAGDLMAAVLPVFSDLDIEVLFEPGRYLVANAGALITKVILTKKNSQKTFVVVDAGMNDFVRPTLYQAVHQIVPAEQKEVQSEIVDVVGPICETGDFFARDRRMPHSDRGDLLGIMGTGAYGVVLASNYNSRLRPPEVLVEGNTFRIIRERESIDALWRGVPGPENFSNGH